MVWLEFQVPNPVELGEKINGMINSKEPVIFDCRVDPVEIVIQ
jgi:hypothetical protein